MDTPPIKETFGPLLASDGTWTRSTWLRVIVSCFTPPPPSLGKWEGWCGGSATPEPTLHQEGFHSWSRNPPPREPFSWKGCACEGKPDTLQAEEKGSSSLSLSPSLSFGSCSHRRGMTFGDSEEEEEEGLDLAIWYLNTEGREREGGGGYRGRRPLTVASCLTSVFCHQSPRSVTVPSRFGGLSLSLLTLLARLSWIALLATIPWLWKRWNNIVDRRTLVSIFACFTRLWAFEVDGFCIIIFFFRFILGLRVYDTLNWCSCKQSYLTVNVFYPNLLR